MTKVGVTVATCATLLWGATALAALTAQQKCQKAKLKAQGTLQSCRKTNAAGMIAGHPDASAACQTKFNTALARADTAAGNAGTSCRYLDNHDETVTDLNTGLVWEKKTAAGTGGVHDAIRGYTWTGPENTGTCATGTDPDGTAFTMFLGTLNNGTLDQQGSTISGCFVGQCDWRLPTIEELSGIVDLSACSSGVCSIDPKCVCIDPTFGPTYDDRYWSATSKALTMAWTVNFHDGARDNFNLKTCQLFKVRAVRGGL